MSKKKNHTINISIHKDNVIEYIVNYFSIFNDRIILWLEKWDLIISLNNESKVFKNWKLLLTNRYENN